MAQYNWLMTDRVACSCVTCPKCGTWVVVRQRTEIGETKVRESCPVPECGKEFEFETGETRVFEVPLPLSSAATSIGLNCADARTGAPCSREFDLQAVRGSAVTHSGFVGRCCWSRDLRWGLRPSCSLSRSSIPLGSLAVLSA